MGLRRAIVTRLGRDLLTEVADQAATKALTEAVAQGGVDPDEHLFRSLTKSNRDLPEITHDRAVKVCYQLYQQTPLGHRITELNRDFVVGDGLRFDARNPQVGELVDEFWNDEVNALDLRLPDFALELGLFGEWIPEAFAGEVSGIVQLGYIDPEQVKGVQTVKDNPLVPDVVRIKSRGSIRGKEMQVIRQRTPGGPLEGDVFFFRVNAVSNATRGWPDLLHIADWLDDYERLLANMVERAGLVRAFIWDVLLKGMSQDQVDAWLRANGQAPKSGTVRAHNEQVEWNAVAPELGSFETAKEADVLLQHIAAGAGIPKTWLSSAEDVNRATAQVMDVPTIRRLTQRQRYFTACVHRIVRYVLEQATAAGRLSTTEGLVPIHDEDGNPTEEMAKPWELVTIHAPEISPRDQTSAGKLLSDVANALAIAEVQGWVGRRPIRDVLAGIFAMLGYDFDPSQEEEGPQPVEPDAEETAQEPPSRGPMEEAVARLLAS